MKVEIHKKIKALIIVLLFTFYIPFYAQVGIGTINPLAKAHVVQTAADEGILVTHTGTSGNGLHLVSSNNSNVSSNIWIQNTTDGVGINNQMLNSANTSSLIITDNLGLGLGLNILQSNTGASASGIQISQDGTDVFSRGIDMYMDGINNPAIGYALFHSGLGLGIYTDLSNTANTSSGWLLRHSGLGDGSVINMLNTNATGSSVGLLTIYRGTVQASGGGGNTAEFQHLGTNGNAVDIFIGDPNSPAGNANTTSEYTGMVVSQMATGTSPTAGRVKAAISATNNSADPTVIVSNNGTDDGDGMQVFTTPNTNNLTTGIYARSIGGTRGVGMWATGGRYGIIGDDNGGAGYGVFSNSDFAAVGAKSFIIDYPLDPENKTLRHYAIESNEVLNMYRGVVILNQDGKATVKLPEYFADVNINSTYQLTAIGTPVQPYIFKEISENNFMIAGAPNTKVSWTVYSERNDPTIRYLDTRGSNYKDEVRLKPINERGKYLTPGAYGKGKKESVFYNKAREKNYREYKSKLYVGKSTDATKLNSAQEKVTKVKSKNQETIKK